MNNKIIIEEFREKLRGVLRFSGLNIVAEKEVEKFILKALADQRQEFKRVVEEIGKELIELYCPNAARFEGFDTYPDCGKCIVCRIKFGKDILKAIKKL